MFDRELIFGDRFNPANVVWEKRDLTIRGRHRADVVMEGVECPRHWSETACTIFADKYLFKGSGDVGPEKSIMGAIIRVVAFWVKSGIDQGLIEKREAQQCRSLFRDMIIAQMFSPNSPQWFNAGLERSYGVKGDSRGNWYNDTTGEQHQCEDNYTHPQLHACFIQSVDNNMIGENGIHDLLAREAKVYKFGSGSGTDYSSLQPRDSRLNNGGTAAGVMSWLELYDANAGAIKSGGSNRRAAHMVVLRDNHPEILDFIAWKAREELKVKALVEGHRFLVNNDPEYAVLARGYDEEHNQGMDRGFDLNLDYDFEGDAYRTVSGQNSNNSVSTSDAFMDAAAAKKGWSFSYNGSPTSTGCHAEWMLDQIAKAAWVCGDPGLQFRDTINKMHMAPSDGPIRASNPCSEYLFCDDTGCNLASINLARFYEEGEGFDFRGFSMACRVVTLILEISVGAGSYPSERVARLSYKHRTLGLGFANLGGVLMRMGLSYDKEWARDFASAVSSLMTASAYEQSALMAKTVGACRGWKENQHAALGVLDRHWRSATHDIAKTAWQRTYELVRIYGLRNMQATVIAPTGTIGLAMDCETLSAEPAYALCQTKKLAGGGTMTMFNPLFEKWLNEWDTSSAVKEAVRKHVEKTGSVLGFSLELDKIAAHFKCANDLKWEDHVLMVAAIQPNISGGISKTINMPESATPEDIKQAYIMAHKLGLKAISVYRDNCKGSQPMARGDGKKANLQKLPENVKLNVITPDVASLRKIVEDNPQDGILPLTKGSDGKLGVHVRLPHSPSYTEPPTDRSGVTHKFRIGGHSGFITVNTYPDGRPCEIFVRMARAGSTLNGMMECFGKSLSLSLQFGVPIGVLVRAFSHHRFEPEGVTGNKDVPIAKSVVDYMARWLGKRFPDVSTIQPRILAPARKPEIATPTITGDSANTCECGGLMVPSGTCLTCSSCGASGGCS